MFDQGTGRTPELLAGTPAGGGQDRTARAIAGLLGGEVAVRNVPGRGGSSAWEMLASRAAEDDVLAVSSPTLITNALLGVSAIDHHGLTPIAQLYTEHSVLVSSPASGVTEPSTVLRQMAMGSMRISFATALGNINHLALAQIARHAGVAIRDLSVRVFDSARHAVGDVLAGNAEAAMVSAASALTEIEDGSLVAVAVTSPRRLGRVFAKVPTWVEAGVDCDLGTWRGLVAPPEVAAESVANWERRLSVMVSDRRWSSLLDDNLWTDTFLDPAGTAVFLDGQRRLLSGLLEETGLLTGVVDG